MARPTPRKSSLSGSPIAPPPALSVAPEPVGVLEAVPELPEPSEAATAPQSAPEQPEATPAKQKAPSKRSARKKPGTPPSSKASDRKPESSRSSARQAASEDVVRIGIYFQPAGFEEAKAAYLADWLNGGEADTFTGWIAAALETHASRGPAGRRAYARPEGRGDVRGMTRTFNLPKSTIETMREAITADQAAGRWTSDSAWCGEAVDAAVAAARERNDGELPKPPARLPNKLKR